MLEAKYGTTFEEYRKRWEDEDRDEDYGWDTEQDFLTWEALTTQQRRLEGMSPWSSRTPELLEQVVAACARSAVV